VISDSTENRGVGRPSLIRVSNAQNRGSAKALAIVRGVLSKACRRCYIDGMERGDRILHLGTRCAVDDEARGLQYFEKSFGKLRVACLRHCRSPMSLLVHYTSFRGPAIDLGFIHRFSSLYREEIRRVAVSCGYRLTQVSLPG